MGTSLVLVKLIGIGGLVEDNGKTAPTHSQRMALLSGISGPLAGDSEETTIIVTGNPQQAAEGESGEATC